MAARETDRLELLEHLLSGKSRLDLALPNQDQTTPQPTISPATRRLLLESHQRVAIQIGEDLINQWREARKAKEGDLTTRKFEDTSQQGFIWETTERYIGPRGREYLFLKFDGWRHATYAKDGEPELKYDSLIDRMRGKGYWHTPQVTVPTTPDHCKLARASMILMPDWVVKPEKSDNALYGLIDVSPKAWLEKYYQISEHMGVWWNARSFWTLWFNAAGQAPNIIYLTNSPPIEMFKTAAPIDPLTDKSQKVTLDLEKGDIVVVNENYVKNSDGSVDYLKRVQAEHNFAVDGQGNLVSATRVEELTLQRLFEELFKLMPIDPVPERKKIIETQSHPQS